LDLAAGEVSLLGEDGKLERRLLSGTPLPVGARLKTGDGARALVRLGDGTRVFLRDNTTVHIDDAVTLESGHLWLEAPPLESGQEARAHRVGETTVALSDGGASLSLEGGEASVYVAEGLAIVTSEGGRSEVNAGEKAIVAQGAAPTVEAVTFWDDWTGGMGDRSASTNSGRSGSGALYAVDRDAAPGSPALPLSIQRQTVKVAIEDQVAETLVDQSFFNPSGKDVEGWYWFSVPQGAQLVSFALETDGQLIEGEVVERRQAAQTYEAAVQRRRDPALLEWVDAQTVRARIFPVPALGERRVVIRYQQLLSETENKLGYSYPLAGPPGKDAPTIEEFSLDLQLHGKLSEEFTVASLTEARVEEEGKRVTMRRSGYTPRADFELELTRKSDEEDEDFAPLRLNEVDPGSDQARFIMLRYTPDLDFDKAEAPRGDVVVVVDTSAAGDASEHQTKLAVAEALLRSLSAGDRFAIMSADVSAQVLYPETELADATPDAISDALERVAQHGTGGATDLGAIFERALERVHGLEQPAIVYIGDGLATSGERGGDALAERLRRSMTGSRARLFTLGVGADVDERLLGTLARVGGGESLRVQIPEAAVVRALQLSGLLKTPTITDLKVDVGEGLDDMFVNATGKLSRGQEMILLARTHHELPDKITVRGRLGGEDFEKEYEVERERGVVDAFVPRLWANTFMERLLGDSRGPEAVRGKILSLGLEYGLMTPYTSFLALESEHAYAQAGIERRNRRFPGPRMTADAGWMRGTEEDASATVMGMLLAAASAPLGCGGAADRAEEPPPAVAQEAEPRRKTSSNADAARSKGEEGEMGRSDDRTATGAVAAKTPQSDPVPEPASVAEVEQQLEEKAVAPGSGGGASKGKKSKKLGGKAGRGSADWDGAGYEDEETDALSVRDEDTKDEYRKADGEAGGGPGDMVATRGGEAVSIPMGGQPEVERLRRNKRPLAVTSPVMKNRRLPCSDAAARSLALRRILWKKRLDRQSNMEGWLEVYEASAGGCEIPGWKDQRVFLQLLQARVATEHDIALLLAHFADQPDARSYLARALLRRLVDPQLIAAVENQLYGNAVDWWAIDRQIALELDDAKQLEILQQALARAPGDPQGERRMIALLVRRGKLDEAVAHGRRLRERGQLTPQLVQQLGEVLVESGDKDAALRVFSEIVEFDPHSPLSRRLLGDIFLRHQWYDDAYRQYEDLLGLVREDPTASIRLARAAAGTGRVDEGLRILRKVSSGEGRPGANDPRRWARLLAASYLAKLLGDDSAPEASVTRELKRLQLFEGPTTWTMVVWEDLAADLVLVEDRPKDDKKNEKKDAASDLLLLGDGVDGAATGLFAVQVAPGDTRPLKVRERRTSIDRDVPYERVTIRFDGKKFSVDRQAGTLPKRQPAAAQVAIAKDEKKKTPAG
jgi:tetratricopeptide (TPR) repeat protein